MTTTAALTFEERLDAAAERAVLALLPPRTPDLIPAVRAMLSASEGLLAALDEANTGALSWWPKIRPDERDAFEDALLNLALAASLEMVAEVTR